MQFFSSLITLLKAIPALVTLITEIAAWMRSVFGENPEQFILLSGEAFKRAREAKTPKERLDAATDIANLIRRL